MLGKKKERLTRYKKQQEVGPQVPLSHVRTLDFILSLTEITDSYTEKTVMIKLSLKVHFDSFWN